MPRPDFASPRLFVDAGIDPSRELLLGRDQAHYLANVLRLQQGDTLLIFNGRDGEWRAELGGSKSRLLLRPGEQTRGQPPASPIRYCFAPLKHARLDYLVQKAVEMGVGVLQPILTRRTQVARINPDRMHANAIEAAEQCGILAVPRIAEPRRLADFLATWPPEDLMVFCDEDADIANPIDALRTACATSGDGIGVAIGPEGGFDASERESFLRLPRRVRLSLGPRILRADTAAVAALALVQAVLGEAASPDFEARARVPPARATIAPKI